MCRTQRLVWASCASTERYSMIGMATSSSDDAGVKCSTRTTPSCRSRFPAIGLVAAGLWLTPAFAAAGDTLQVTDARVSASNDIGIDLPLLMTIRNDAAEADALLRVRCPFANFSEKHTIDRGEGAPAMRAVKLIPVPENKTTELKQDGFHVMLLQTRQKLVHGEKFTCAITFLKAGTKETEVQVSQTP
jgi:periplasmic copper chaperone A